MTETNSILISIATGIASSVVIGLFLILLQWFRLRKLRQLFHKKKFYLYTFQRPHQPFDEKFLTVKRNRILFGPTPRPDCLLFEGEFIIDELNLRYGQGFHTQDGMKFGFSQVVIEDGKIFVYAPYVKPIEDDGKYLVNPHGQIQHQSYYFQLADHDHDFYYDVVS